MQQVTYDDASYPIRQDFAEAHSRFWQRLRSPGPSLSSAQRIDVAREVRAAQNCRLCIERKSALSPAHVQGEHDAVSELSSEIIEAVHAITTDPSRLTKAWYDSLIDQGLSDSAYVEIVGTVVSMVSIDSFAVALGLDLRELPEPGAGEPTGYRPATAELTDQAWVPMVNPEVANTPEADLWESGLTSNVIRAMSLAPDEVRTLKEMSAAHYLPLPLVRQAGVNGGRSITRSQIELVAGRVSALNECYY